MNIWYGFHDICWFYNFLFLFFEHYVCTSDVLEGYNISHNEKATLFSGLIEHCVAYEKIMFGQQ